MVAKLHKNIPWFQGDVKTFGNCIVTKKALGTCKVA